VSANGGFAATDAAPATGSLVTGVGSILSSSFSVGLGRAQIFAAGDLLSLTVTQPQRVERANAALALEAVDPANGAILMRSRTATLVPSGRELAVETAYRAAHGPWLMQANLAYRFDAGHVAGRDDLRAALTLSRAF
jgi:hypothetical protein